MLDFSSIVEILEEMEQTTSRLELTDYLVTLFKIIHPISSIK
jgi:hypothetical protein